MWLNKCYSFPCFYNKKKHLVRKLYHFEDWHLPSFKPYYSDMERGKGKVACPWRKQAKHAGASKVLWCSWWRACKGGSNFWARAPAPQFVCTVGRRCYVSLWRGAGGSLFWQRPTCRVGIQQFILAVEVESQEVQGWAWSHPRLPCSSWRGVSRSKQQDNSVPWWQEVAWSPAVIVDLEPFLGKSQNYSSSVHSGYKQKGNIFQQFFPDKYKYTCEYFVCSCLFCHVLCCKCPSPT